MRTFLRDNGLTLALGLMFLASVAGMVLTGQAAFNKELLDHGQPALGLAAYVSTGEFLSALFENWESEFLQMAAYVVLTAMLFKRGSSGSRDPDDPGRPNDELPWRDRHPLAAWIYAHSLGLALALLFLASFLLHWWFSMTAANEEALRHGAEVQTSRQLSVRSTALVRVLPKLAVGILVDRSSRRAVDFPAAPGLTRIEARCGRQRGYWRMNSGHHLGDQSKGEATMTDRLKMQDPRKQYPGPPFPRAAAGRAGSRPEDGPASRPW